MQTIIIRLTKAGFVVNINFLRQVYKVDLSPVKIGLTPLTAIGYVKVGFNQDALGFHF